MSFYTKEQAWFWTPEWQAKEREAEAEMASGRYKEFTSADELVCFLKRNRDLRG